MVATDIAARGIHVDGIDLVIHADSPTEHKAYLHGPRGRDFVRRPSRRPSRPLRRLVVARRRSRLVSAAAAADPALPIVARCRTRILGPAATIRRRSKHAIHGAASVAMSADGLIVTPMFINSSGSPGSWPSWATDVRYLMLNLRRHQETSKTFPESDILLGWRTGPS